MGGFKFARGYAMPFIGTFGVHLQKLCSSDGNWLKKNNQPERGKRGKLLIHKH